MSDPIKPPAARLPEETLELVSQALSDGDLEAALAQYESPALMAHWPGRPTDAGSDVRGTLAAFMALRLPLSVRITMVLSTSGLALVVCDRRVAGTGPDGEQVRQDGRGCAVVRPQPDGTWRIAADAWDLGAELRPDPAGVSPGYGAALLSGSTTIGSGQRFLSIIPL